MDAVCPDAGSRLLENERAGLLALPAANPSSAGATSGAKAKALVARNAVVF
jgi:hypothetical protein